MGTPRLLKSLIGMHCINVPLNSLSIIIVTPTEREPTTMDYQETTPRQETVKQFIDAFTTAHLVKVMAKNGLHLDPDARIPKSTVQKILWDQRPAKNGKLLPLITKDLVELLILCRFESVSSATIDIEEDEVDCFVGLGFVHENTGHAPKVEYMSPGQLYAEDAQIQATNVWFQEIDAYQHIMDYYDMVEDAQKAFLAA